MAPGRIVLVSALALGLLSALNGCANTYEVTRTTGTADALERLTSVYVALSADSYEPFSRIAAQKVAAAFNPYLFPTVATKQQDMAEALKSAKNEGFTYLLYPEILHWEAGSSVWSTASGRVSVKVSLIRAGTGDVLDSAVVSGESGLFGGDRPEDLLSKPLADYASSLFPNHNKSQ